MNIPELFNSLVNQNFRLTVENDEIVVNGSGPLTSEQQKSLTENKTEILRLLEPAEIVIKKEIDREVIGPHDAIQFGSYWISAEDHQYLTTSPPQDPCPWCGCRTTHTPGCITLSADWAVKMPFGKYKGTPIRNIDQGYLGWVLRTNMELKKEVLTEIKNELHLRGCCFAQSEEEAERETIQWADENPEEAFAKAEEIGDWFLEQSKHRAHRTFLWNQVGAICNERELNEFRKRFLADTQRHDDFRDIADEILELIENRRKIIREWWSQ